MTSTNASDTLKNASNLLQQTVSTFANLIEQSANLSFDLLNSLTSTTPTLDLSAMKLPALPMPSSCGCKIPPPCWMPRSAGCVVSHVCPGSPATLRVRITNCGPTGRTISFDDAGKSQVTFQPGKLTLGPMEAGVVTATLATSSSQVEGGEQSALVWIHGCMDHYVRWTVKTVKRGAACCHEICLEDCPDFIHHWYDHFYCARPCPSPERNG